MNSNIPGRPYRKEDAVMIAVFGIGCGLMAVMVLAIYVTSEAVEGLYRHPLRLLLVCPVVLYWVARVWMLANRGKVDGDPVAWAVKDGVTRGCVAITGIIFWEAS